jgi:hypothetical protein
MTSNRSVRRSVTDWNADFWTGWQRRWSSRSSGSMKKDNLGPIQSVDVEMALDCRHNWRHYVSCRRGQHHCELGKKEILGTTESTDRNAKSTPGHYRLRMGRRECINIKTLICSWYRDCFQDFTKCRLCLLKITFSLLHFWLLVL